MAKAGGGRRQRPISDAEALRLLVDAALVDADHDQAEPWLDLTVEEADKVIADCRGRQGVLGFRARLLSGDHGVPSAVHTVLQQKGLTSA